MAEENNTIEKKPRLDVVEHTCNTSTWEDEAVESWVLGQPELPRKTLSWTKEEEREEKGEVEEKEEEKGEE